MSSTRAPRRIMTSATIIIDRPPLPKIVGDGNGPHEGDGGQDQGRIHELGVAATEAPGPHDGQEVHPRELQTHRPVGGGGAQHHPGEGQRQREAENGQSHIQEDAQSHTPRTIRSNSRADATMWPRGFRSSTWTYTRDRSGDSMVETEPGV